MMNGHKESAMIFYYGCYREKIEDTSIFYYCWRNEVSNFRLGKLLEVGHFRARMDLMFQDIVKVIPDPMRLTKNLKKKKFFEIEFFLLAEKKLEITVLAMWLSALITITFAATSTFFFLR